MKFEKVSVEEFARSLRSCMKPGETERMFQEKVAYFKDKLTVPKRSTGGSAGYDFICPFDIYIKPGEIAKIPTGVKVELDKDKFLGIYIRSSFGTKRNLELTNKVCIIDSDYYNNERNEGHILEFVRNNNDVPVTIKQGEAFCQGIIQTFFTVEGDDYGNGPKRVGGIGSTDNQNREMQQPAPEVKEEAKVEETEVKTVEDLQKETEGKAEEEKKEVSLSDKVEVKEEVQATSTTKEENTPNVESRLNKKMMKRKH